MSQGPSELAEALALRPAVGPRMPYVLRQLLRRPLALLGLAVLTAVVAMAVFAPLIAPHDPYEQDISQAFAGPSWSHPMGRDHLGRDIFSRVIFGSRTSLQVAMGAVGFAVAVGVILGMLGGYFGGAVDAVIMRVADAVLAFPGLLLTIAIAALLGTGLQPLIIAVGVTGVPNYARLLRGNVLATKNRDYVEAARALGAGHLRLMLWHIWPNSLQPIIVQATLGAGFATLIAAGASFLGVGAQPPTPDWGLMISTSHQYVFSHPWLSVPPGIAIMLTVLGFNLLGDGLRDALDPRLRGMG